jgi:peptide/nickel transport system permease protein
MLALVMMYMALSVFNWSVLGLFSYEYVDAPWSIGKVVDMLEHIWVPMVILGTAGTARFTRVVRANLLDELRKPYVVTARAKG